MINKFTYGLCIGVIGILNVFFLMVHIYFIANANYENYSVFNGIVHVVLLFTHATWVSEVVDQ